MKASLAKGFKAVGSMFTRKSVWHVTAICALFGLVIVGGAYTARHGASLFGSSTPPEAGPRTDNITGVAGLKDDDPVKNFTKTGVGQVLFTASSTDNCKRTLFDNNTGTSRVVADINCGNNPESNFDDKKSEQLNSMRKAFGASSKK